MNIEDDGWFDRQASRAVKTLLVVWVVGAIAAIGALLGVIYFIFWCLKHFGVIG